MDGDSRRLTNGRMVRNLPIFKIKICDSGALGPPRRLPAIGAHRKESITRTKPKNLSGWNSDQS